MAENFIRWRKYKTFEELDDIRSEIEFKNSILKNEELDASKKRIMIKAVEDWCTISEAKQSARVSVKDWKRMKEDEWFLQELEYAIDSDIRLAKSKVRLGLEKDDCEEFALKVLKAKRPSEYGTQIVNSKNEIKAEVEHKSVDDMLVEYYQED